MNYSLNSPLTGSLGIAWVVTIWFLTAVVHVGFAFGVYADSRSIWHQLRRNTFAVSGEVWALATLLGGVLVAGIYWAVHHSTLRPAQATDLQPEKPLPEWTP